MFAKVAVVFSPGWWVNTRKQLLSINFHSRQRTRPRYPHHWVLRHPCRLITEVVHGDRKWRPRVSSLFHSEITESSKAPLLHGLYFHHRPPRTSSNNLRTVMRSFAENLFGMVSGIFSPPRNILGNQRSIMPGPIHQVVVFYV